MKMPRVATINHRLAGLLSIVILLSTSEAMLSISCPSLIEQIAPCASFLQQNNLKQPSQACCNGIEKLIGEAAGNQKVRTAICRCLKQGLAMIGNYDPRRISLLPKDCGLSITLPPIDQHTNCSNFFAM